MNVVSLTEQDIRLPVANILAHVFAFNWKMPGAVNINYPIMKTFIEPHILDLQVALSCQKHFFHK